MNRIGALLLAAAVAATSCVGETPATSAVVGSPAVEEIPDPPTEGWACPSGPTDCDFGLGCRDGFCGGCVDPEQCRGTEGCREDFTCGACATDRDCRGGESCVTGFCLADELPEWDIEVAPEDLALIREDHWEETYVPARLRVGDVVYGPADLRLYGGSSRGWPKSSFRIRFPEDAEHPGFTRKINLRAEFNDRSYLRTFVGYETFRRLTRLPVPRARYLSVSINGEPWGLMLEVERLGGKFLSVNGRDREAPMFEAQQDWPGGAFMPIREESDWRYVWNQKTGPPDDFTPLQEFVEEALWLDYRDSPSIYETTMERTREAFEVDAYIDYLALMTLIQNQDHITNNFYTSLQAPLGGTPRWEVYPYDVDLTFGCTWSEQTGTLCDEIVWDRWWVNGPIADPDADYCWCNLAMHLCLNEAQGRARYEQRLCSYTGSDWWTWQGPALADALAVQLEPYVAEDTRDRVKSLDDWRAAREDVVRFFTLRAGHLRGEVGCD